MGCISQSNFFGKLLDILCSWMEITWAFFVEVFFVYCIGVYLLKVLGALGGGSVCPWKKGAALVKCWIASSRWVYQSISLYRNCVNPGFIAPVNHRSPKTFLFQKQCLILFYHKDQEWFLKCWKIGWPFYRHFSVAEMEWGLHPTKITPFFDHRRCGKRKDDYRTWTNQFLSSLYIEYIFETTYPPHLLYLRRIKRFLQPVINGAKNIYNIHFWKI